MLSPCVSQTGNETLLLLLKACMVCSHQLRSSSSEWSFHPRLAWHSALYQPGSLAVFTFNSFYFLKAVSIGEDSSQIAFLNKNAVYLSQEDPCQRERTLKTDYM